MRLVLTLSLLALGCTEDPPPSGPAIESHVESYDFPRSYPPQLDLLIVLDHTTAMAPYQTALAALPAGIVDVLDDPGELQADARIAVTIVDGAGGFRQPSTTTDDYLAFGYDVHYRREANFTGTLTDAIAQLVNVGASGAGTAQPLASAKTALDAHASFLRDGAALGILTIAATDDASSGTILDYSSPLKARKSDPLEVAVSGVYPAGASRLAAFHAQFPNRATSADIATADFSGALGVIASLPRTLLGVPCGGVPADVDADTPGPQYECDLHADYDDGTSEPVRQCKMDSVGPCFQFVVEPQVCPFEGTARFYLTGFPTRWYPAVRGQCVVTGQN